MNRKSSKIENAINNKIMYNPLNRLLIQAFAQ